MQSGKLLINGDDFYCGNSSNSLKQLALKSDIPDTASIPSGIITMWSGPSSNIPSGWLLCNGSNGTPDLRDRFIVGAGNSYSVGNTGGSASVTLTTNQMPSHSHGNNFSVSVSGTTTDDGEHTHVVGAGSDGTNYGYVAAAPRMYDTITIDGGAHKHTFRGTGSLSGSISNSGGSQAHENRPPYYAICFIMKS